MLKILRNCAYSIWLGFILGFCGIYVTSIEFYVIVVPTILFVTLIKRD
jgi:hypothetical protein